MLGKRTTCALAFSLALCTAKPIASRWSARWRHAALQLASGELMLLGGHDGAFRNDVWIGDAAGESWTEVRPASGRWAPRWGHACVRTGNATAVVLLGGQGETTLFNDVWVSLTKGATWSAVSSEGVRWSPRFGHAVILVHDDVLLLMGGWDGTYRGDVWRGAAHGASWEEVPASGPRWPARWGHACTVSLNRSRIVLAGGYAGGSHFGDVWLSDSLAQSWERVTINGSQWAPRSEHRLVALLNGSLLLMGGHGGGSGFAFSDTWIGSPDASEWTAVELRGSPNAQEPADPMTVEPTQIDQYTSWRLSVSVGAHRVSFYDTGFTTLSSGSYWGGGVLAPNGKVYMMPSGAPRALVFDPVTKHISFIELGKQIPTLGAVLAANGKIYGCPDHGTNDLKEVVVIDTRDDTWYTLTFSKGGRYAGAVLATNEVIYLVPHQGEPSRSYQLSFAAIDPQTDAVTFIDTDIVHDAGTDLFTGGVLGPNGKVYCVARRAPKVLVLNPLATPPTWEYTLENPLPGPNTYSGGVLAHTGSIYFMPRSGSTSPPFVKITPGANGDTIQALNKTTAPGSGCVGGVQALDGIIYCIPFGLPRHIVALDPASDTSSVIYTLSSSATAAYIGGVLTPGGTIVAVPFREGRIMEFGTGLPRLTNWPLGAQVNKF